MSLQLNNYQERRKWSDQFIPDIKRKVGPLLLIESPFDVDTKQAADLIVLSAKSLSIAARVRRHGYADRYPYDFTIRSKIESGKETELSKMLNGFGDWMFYGHAAQEGPTVDRWMLLDLNIWRGVLLRNGYRGSGWNGMARQMDNGDGTQFFVFDVRHFPKAILIGGSA